MNNVRISIAAGQMTKATEAEQIIGGKRRKQGSPQPEEVSGRWRGKDDGPNVTEQH